MDLAATAVAMSLCINAVTHVVAVIFVLCQILLQQLFACNFVYIEFVIVHCLFHPCSYFRFYYTYIIQQNAYFVNWFFKDFIHLSMIFCVFFLAPCLQRSKIKRVTRLAHSSTGECILHSRPETALYTVSTFLS